MEPVILQLRIQSLKAQLDVCQLVWASLARELHTSHLTSEQKAALNRRWDIALKESRDLQHAIDMLERQETETRVNAVR